MGARVSIRGTLGRKINTSVTTRRHSRQHKASPPAKPTSPFVWKDFLVVPGADLVAKARLSFNFSRSTCSLACVDALPPLTASLLIIRASIDGGTSSPALLPESSRDERCKLGSASAPAAEDPSASAGGGEKQAASIAAATTANPFEGDAAAASIAAAATAETAASESLSSPRSIAFATGREEAASVAAATATDETAVSSLRSIVLATGREAEFLGPELTRAGLPQAERHLDLPGLEGDGVRGPALKRAGLPHAARAAGLPEMEGDAIWGPPSLARAGLPQAAIVSGCLALGDVDFCGPPPTQAGLLRAVGASRFRELEGDAVWGSAFTRAGLAHAAEASGGLTTLTRAGLPRATRGSRFLTLGDDENWRPALARVGLPLASRVFDLLTLYGLLRLGREPKKGRRTTHGQK